MAFYKRYEGKFVSQNDHIWTCQIWQEAQQAYTVGELTFPYESPLTIEWAGKTKHDVICGSTATLTIVSPADRTYLDLYTIRPGRIRLDVLKDNVLYWSGCLDPEHSEEPYYTDKEYEVSLVFSDFGILKRLKYNLSGIQTMEAIFSDAMTRSKLHVSSVNQSLISTYLGSNKITTQSLSFRSDNFYDEEDEAMTLYEVIEGIMQPLALKVIQRAGVVYIFDINALVAASGTQISWQSTDQVLGMDAVYNNVNVTFSPYGNADPFPEFAYTGEHSTEFINLTTSDPTSELGVECYSYYPTYDNASGHYESVQFTVFCNDLIKGIASKGLQTKCFYIEPVLGGSSMEGVALFFYAGHMSRASGQTVRKGYQSTPSTSFVIWASKRTYLPKLSSADAAKYRLRLNVPVILDARYNPFEDAGDYNEKDNYNFLKNFFASFAVPVLIQLYDDSGNVVAHYENASVIDSATTTVAALYNTLGTWVSGPASLGDAYLFYYDMQGGIAGGVADTRQAYNLIKRPVRSAALEAAEEGQYMPYPGYGGYIEVKICAGLEGHALFGGIHTSLLSPSYFNRFRWWMFGGPKMDIIKATYTGDDLSADDVQYSGTINVDAEEGLDIGTICGTMENIVPTARGLILNASNSEAITTLTRQGRTARPEKLLIGTMFSQHADRMDTLTGTASLMDGALAPLTDANLSGKKLMLSSDAQDVRAELSQIQAVEIVADEYIEQ